MAAPDLVHPSVSHPFAPRLRWTLALFCLAVLALLTLQVMRHGPMLELDQGVSLYFSRHRTPVVTGVMAALSAMHQTVWVLAATALIALVLGLRKAWESMRALLVVPVGMLLNVGLKDMFRRARPHWDDPLVQLASYSFPSGHALAATVFYGMLCALVFEHTRSRLWRGVAATVTVVMVVLVCLSRVYLGAHYPVDVIAGVAEGTFCVLLFLGWLRR
jgi:undecaprenyl-diphosphatase